MSVTKGALRTEIKKVGIVGCGLMGSGYTQLCAQHGYKVVVCDVNDGILNKGLAMIDFRLKYNVSQGQLSEQDKDAILARIKGTISLGDFSDCDLIVETATEKMEVKKEVFADLDRICPEDIVLATNTSVLSMLDMAMATSRPDRVLGMHMNPLMFPITEIIKTLVTSDEALEVAKNFSQALSKNVVIAKDTPGFIVNRLMIPLFLGAIRMLAANTAGRDEIDAAFTGGMGWPLGPLGLVDATGLDTHLLAANALYEELKEPQYAPPVLLKKMVTAGWLGVKTGKGFYEYDQ